MKSSSPSFWKQIVAVVMSSLMIFFSVPLYANPEGESVVGGTASFDRNGSTLQITTSDRAIINWQNFSINAGELTKFIQPSVTSATLNRVTSGNPSSILGDLQANGQIYLINPNGIMVGAGATVNTASFIASTLDVKDSEFMAGRGMTFAGESTSGIQNLGFISARGGNVYLIGHTVENAGTIQASQGTVGLAAGQEVYLAQDGDSFLSVQITPVKGISAEGVKNSGIIEAAQAELKSHGNMYALAINQGGVISATGAINRDGRVILASSGGKISSSGKITANNVDGAGGAINIDADSGEIALSGTMIAEGKGNGSINLSADSVVIRDSNGNPLQLRAGKLLSIEGKNLIDIFALNNSSSTLYSGGDFILKSDAAVYGDAHYFTGGNFLVQKMDGTLQDLESPFDPVIQSMGDVSLRSYTGASLHILAGGSVTISGKVTITRPEGETEGDNNEDNEEENFNEGGREGVNYLVETITLSDETTLEIDGHSKATLDIRAGIDFGEDSPQQFNEFQEGESEEPSSADISIGSIVLKQPGLVFLTTQYQKNNSLEGGSITIDGNIDAGSNKTSCAGGSVVIDSRESITVGEINTFVEERHEDAGSVQLLANGDVSIGDISAFSSNSECHAGNGNSVQILAREGNITVGNVYTYSFGNQGSASGGAINLTAENGSIETGMLDSSSTSENGYENHHEYDEGEESHEEVVGTGDGGAIKLIAAGSINLNWNDVKTSSYAQNGSSGKGGEISIIAGEWIEGLGYLDSSSESYISEDFGNSQNSNDGGRIYIESNDGDLELYTAMSYSRAVTGDSGNGGDISVIANGGSIYLEDASAYSYSEQGNSGNGGGILIHARDSVEMGEEFESLHSQSEALFGDSGNGGKIIITADTGDIYLTDIESFSRGGNNAGDGGVVEIVAPEGSISLYSIDSSVSIFRERYDNEGENEFNVFTAENSNEPTFGKGGGVFLHAGSGGVYFDWIDATGTVGTGNIFLKADQMDFYSVTGRGSLLLQPSTNGVGIEVGGEGPPGDLSLNPYLLGSLTPGFNGIFIGNTFGVSELRVSEGGVTFNDPVTLLSAGDILLNGPIATTGNHDITFAAGRDFKNNAGPSAVNPGLGILLIYLNDLVNYFGGGLPIDFIQGNSPPGTPPIARGWGLLLPGDTSSQSAPASQGVLSDFLNSSGISQFANSSQNNGIINPDSPGQIQGNSGGGAFLLTSNESDGQENDDDTVSPGSTKDFNGNEVGNPPSELMNALTPEILSLLQSSLTD